ncbi:MAG: phosphoribosylaminoimidazolesuccinocarboxamide synthase [Deltaproteobacteria bacterium]|nr:MAG: phosphoribosylaminoimidazolesuccinocarboxamide synthase [Deltaproteobacteria bacterium]
MTQSPLFETDFPDLTLLNRGKVRDIYNLGKQLLIVATDRISAYDVVMPTPIPEKGRILTQISTFWFGVLGGVVDNHLVATDVASFPEQCQPYVGELSHRSMLVKKAEPLPVECIVRGYLSGSGWKDYLERGSVCGIDLPKGLVESAPLERPIFTPSTKAEKGTHDENIDFAALCDRVGRELAEQLRELSLALYKKGVTIASRCGILIADTKFEFGLVDGKLTLIDEVLTPDSSRFWPADRYQPGGSQESFDKQYLRDYLDRSGWNRTPPAPALPEKVVSNTRARYMEALARLSTV